MTGPGFSSWQAQNANQHGADAARRARQSAEYSGRLARRSGRSSVVGTLIALVIVGVIVAVAAPFVLQILARTGF